MRKVLLATLLSLLLTLAVTATAFGQDGEAETSYYLWLGAHYIDFNDYMNKVGEYTSGEDEEVLPSFKAGYKSIGDGQVFTADAEYEDEKNFDGEVNTFVGDRFSAKVKYRSFTKLAGANLLEVMAARESVGGNPGGKMITHDILDPEAEYYTQRKEIKSDLSVLLERNHNIRLMVAHRSVLQTGMEEKISNNHCFSCHLTSTPAKIDKITHAIIAKLQGDVGKHTTVGYEIGYRQFESEVPPTYALFDDARHPVYPSTHPKYNGTRAEFGSRVNFDDGYYPISEYPKTKKISHKLRVKGDLGKGKYAGSISYSKATNDYTDIGASAWVGNLSYSVPLNEKTRLVASVSGIRYDVDSFFVDLPHDFREGRPGTVVNFDFTRLSSLNRADGRGSLELIKKVNPKLTASVKLGIDFIDRYNYPADDFNNTTRFKGQVKAMYRKGLTYSTSVKYRLELTTDPFTSNRGLFELPGNVNLSGPDAAGFIYYYQREALRYQKITTEPTQEHIFEWHSNWHPNKQTNINLGLKFNHDKNGDLDSLDVKHTMIQPNLALNYTPNPKWMVTAGYTWQNYKSSGPVTVALFDG